MSVMTMLQAAQGGKLFSHVAESLDLDEAETRKAMGLLCPAIAGRLKDAAAADGIVTLQNFNLSTNKCCYY